MIPGIGTCSEYRTSDERREVLENSAPKIVDERKFYGPIADDMRSIKRALDRLHGKRA